MADNGNDAYVEVEQIAEAKAYQAKEIQHLLKQDSFQACIRATELRILKEWERGENPLAREMAWHKLQAFRALLTELRAYSQRPHLT